MFSKKSNQTLHHVIIKIKSNNLYCYHETQTTRCMMLPGKPNQMMHNVMIEQNKRSIKSSTKSNQTMPNVIWENETKRRILLSTKLNQTMHNIISKIQQKDA